MKEYKVGDVLEYKNELYEVVEGHPEGCFGCCFEHETTCPSSHNEFECSSDHSPLMLAVYRRKLSKVGEFPLTKDEKIALTKMCGYCNGYKVTGVHIVYKSQITVTASNGKDVDTTPLINYRAILWLNKLFDFEDYELNKK